tara:strand:+ start:994 stop:1140 length:147 start_codon:yes stop_codon:yes gene_type:complete
LDEVKSMNKQRSAGIVHWHREYLLIAEESGLAEGKSLLKRRLCEKEIV